MRTSRPPGVSTRLAGVFPVVSTPFDQDEEIDRAVLHREIGWLIDHEVDGVVIAMVSEILRLGEGERRVLAEAVVESVAGCVPVVVSVGAESTKVSRELAGHARSVGAAAVMAIPPLSVSLSEDAVEEYYRSLIESVDLPVIVQDASGYVGRPLSIGLYMALLERFGPERVLFKPEAPPIGPRLTLLREASGGAARVFEGTGGLALVDSYRRGIVGTIPGPEIPWAIVALWRALERGDTDTVDAINGPLVSLVSTQTSIDSFIAVEKHLLVRQGVFELDVRRTPNGFELDPETIREVDRLVDLLRRVVTEGVPGRADGPRTQRGA